MNREESKGPLMFPPIKLTSVDRADGLPEVFLFYTVHVPNWTVSRKIVEIVHNKNLWSRRERVLQRDWHPSSLHTDALSFSVSPLTDTHTLFCLWLFTNSLHTRLQPSVSTSLMLFIMSSWVRAVEKLRPHTADSMRKLFHSLLPFSPTHHQSSLGCSEWCFLEGLESLSCLFPPCQA